MIYERLKKEVENYPILMYSVWESDWNGRDYPTYYTDKREALNHYNESKGQKPQYVSIRECIVKGWNTDEMEVLDEDNIESYYSEDEEI